MRRPAFTLAALLIASIATFAAHPQILIAQSNAQAVYQQGEAQLEQDAYTAALSSFDRAIQTNPNFSFPYSGRCAAYLALGNGQAATEDCDRAILLNPTPALFYVRRGYLRLAQGDLEGALSDAEQALLDDPESADAHNIYGEAFIGLGELQAALLDLNLALRIDSEFARAYGNRGQVNLALGNQNAAVRDYTRAVRIEPTTSVTPSLQGLVAGEFVSSGEAQLNREDLEGALQDFDLALGIVPNFAPAYAGRGEVFLAAGNEDAAEAEFEQALAFDPNNVIARNRLQELQPEPSPTPSPAVTPTPEPQPDDQISLEEQSLSEEVAEELAAAFEELDICGPIEEGTLYEEVVDIIGMEGTVVEEEGEETTYQWSGTREVSVQGQTEQSTYELTATFSDDEIIDFECMNIPSFLQS